MASTTSGISIWQKLDLVPAVLQSLCGTALSTLCYPFLARAPRTLKRHFFLTLMRKTFSRLSTAQLQYFAGSTESNYIKWTTAERLPFRSVQLAYANTKAFWIGDTEAENVLLYFHGGGWGMPGSEAHFGLLFGLIKRAVESHKSIAALVLQYKLAPASQYPQQMTQCVQLLRYVLDILKKPPGQILLGGDSAGGNMVCGVLSHLLHPHPSLKPLTLSQPLKLAFLSSPVVYFDFSTERFQKHEIYEPAPVSTLKEWVANYLGESAKDGWNEPGQNDSDWWKGLDRVVGDVLVTESAYEVFADDVEAMVAKVKVVYPKLTYFSSKLDFHAEPGIGPAVGIEESEAARHIKSWIYVAFYDTGNGFKDILSSPSPSCS